MTSALRLRDATPDDAEAIAALVLSLSGPFFVHPDRAGAEPFLASIGADAQRERLQSSRFRWRLAEQGGQLAALAALRDGSHMFHLFVAPAHQRQGLARRLWHDLREAALADGRPERFTVNASLNAQPVYARFGFQPQGEVQQMHGIAFQPMCLPLVAAAHDRSSP